MFHDATGFVVGVGCGECMTAEILQWHFCLEVISDH